mmetsp:Transcript_7806/g.7984  ORF Transcript_7806/g.7984 Transcript_7806/m.7984 type:complete len:287 (-) Transcript_7806:215-1075(-)
MLFKDLGKPIRDFLEKDFLVSNVLSVKTRSESGVEWKTEGELLPERTVSGKLSASYKSDTGLSLDNLRVTSEGRVLAEASLQQTENLKLKVSAEDGRQEPGRPLQSLGKLGFEYSFPQGSLLGDIDVVNGPTLYGSMITKYYRMKLGIESKVNTHLEDKDESFQLVDLNLGAIYTGYDWSGCIKTYDLFSFINISYIQHVSPSLNISGYVNYGLKSNYQKLILASQYHIDPYTSIKLKMDSTSKISASFTQKISSAVKLVLSTQLHMDAKEGTPDTSKVGIGLYFE